jgi:hypothetical protein
MNRQWAFSLGLRQFNKPKPAMIVGYREGDSLITADREYMVHNSSWRFIGYRFDEHEFPVPMRPTKHISKHYPPKHPAVISEKARLINANLPN